MTTAPAWFEHALATPPELHRLPVDGVEVVYRAWGRKGDPVVVLIHGGAAHSGWWDHVGPHLAARHRVLALDLTGHGDSGWRPVYALTTWAEEVLAVARAESSLPPILFGHSMGGFVALAATRDHGEKLHGVATLDSPVRALSAEDREWLASNPQPRPLKVRPAREDVVARFRPLPDDGPKLPYVVAHVADGSVREVEGGWTWKFDPKIFLRARLEPDTLTEARCEVALIRSENGLATTDMTDDVVRRLGGHVPVTVVPGAGHHLMLDEPVALIATLQTLLGQWSKP